MVESWESCVFSMPEIVCTRSTPYPYFMMFFNVEVALKQTSVCDLDASLKGSKNVFAWVAFFYSRMTLPWAVLRCRYLMHWVLTVDMIFMVIFHLVYVFDLILVLRVTPGDVCRCPFAIWQAKMHPSARSRSGSLSPSLNDNGCRTRQEHIYWPICY